MKGINLIMLGVIFLMSLPFIPAQYDWATYGNSYTPLWNEQFTGGYGRFDTGINNVSFNYGYTSSIIEDTRSFQALVTHFNISGTSEYKEYLIFPNGNYLQIYDDSLNLRQEISTGNEVISQIDTLFWTGDTSSKDIAGIWKQTSTLLAFRIYSYNITSNSLKLNFEQNFTTSSNLNVTTGIKHSGEKAIFILPLSKVGTNYTSQFIIINRSGIQTQTTLDNQNCFFTEPIAFYDIDADSRTEYLTYCSEKVIAFESGGTIDFTYNKQSSLYIIRDARMFHPDLSSIWKIAVLEAKGTLPSTTSLIVKKPDGTTIWSDSWSLGGATGRLAITDDYDGDGLNDIFMASFGASFTTFYINDLTFKVLKGTNGNELNTKTYADVGNARGFEGATSLTIADMNNDDYQEFIFSYQDGYYIYDIKNQQMLLSRNATTCPCSYVFTSCIPADLNLDGFQEVICSGRSKTYIFYSTTTNSNPIINSVTFSPSTSIIRYTTLGVVIDATDSEGNSPIYYKIKCSDSLNWSDYSINSVQSCYYGNIGSFNLTIAVRDIYHSTYNSFSQTIIVTETGTICGNAICEAGENNVNCPTDCPSNVTTTQATDTGGMPLPTKIVDLDNTEQGLLPEIYYGLLGFLSNTLTPMIILIFAIFFVMIMLSLAFIIKKVAHRVGDLAH